jgi:hypothetical protein
LSTLMISRSTPSVNCADPFDPSDAWLALRELAQLVGYRLARRVMKQANHVNLRSVKVIQFEHAADVASLILHEEGRGDER